MPEAGAAENINGAWDQSWDRAAWRSRKRRRLAPEPEHCGKKCERCPRHHRDAVSGREDSDSIRRHNESPEDKAASGKQRRRVVHGADQGHGLQHQGATVKLKVPLVTWVSTERTFQITLYRPGLSAPNGTISTLRSFSSTCALPLLTVVP